MRTLLIQVLLNGLVSGLVFALLAAGFSLIFGTARLLFFAHGEVYMLGAVGLYLVLRQTGIPYFVAVVSVSLILGVFGLAIERVLYRPLRAHGLSFAISTLALAMIVSSAALLTFGEKPKGVPTPLPGKIKLFGAFLTLDRLLLIFVSMAILIGLHFFLQRTWSGRAIRAVSQDEETAALQGVDVNRTNMLTFFIALAVAGAGGGLMAPLYSIDAFMGTPILMVTLIVVVLGGLGSFPGAIAGGLFLGLVQSFGYTFIGGLTTIFMFIVVMLVILFRPQGLFGGRA